MKKLLIGIILIVISVFGMFQIANAGARVNLWIAMSEQAVDAYKDYPSGPMDEATHTVLSKMHDARVVQAMFPTVNAGGKTYKMFSIYLNSSEKAKDAIDGLIDNWSSHFFVVGAWWMDGGQVGTQWTDETRTEVTGEPLYPIHLQAYKFMRDEHTYDGDGNITSTTPPTSNADLRDVNVLTYQSFRRFN